jgi:DNA-binding GntR family transcriptional regulator
MSSHSARPKKGTLRESAYEVLLSAIIFGDIPAGSRIDEKMIAETFNLGIASVRDALFRLSLEKMVERHARVGTSIPALGFREIQEVFEARVIVEGACAGMAADRASPAEVAQLKSAFDGYKAAIANRDYRKLVRMDQVFHRTMAASSRNAYFEQALVLLHNNASRFWFVGLPRIPSKALIGDIEGHLEVASAIEAHDAPSATRAIRDVLGHFPDYMTNLLASPQLYAPRDARGRTPQPRGSRRRAAAPA